MLYFAWGINKPDIQNKRSALIRKHWDFIDEYQERLVARGPVLEFTNTSMVLGSIHILDIDSLIEAKKFVYNEPFASAGLFKSIIFHQFQNKSSRTQFEFTRNPENKTFFLYCPNSIKHKTMSNTVKKESLSYYNDFAEHIICWGSLISDRDEELCNIFFVEFLSLDNTRIFLKNDPYSINNHYDNPEIHRWAPGGRENLTPDGKLP